MNTKQLIATIVVLAASGSALAQSNNSATFNSEFTAPDANFVSTKTREQVYNELKQSKADGSYELAHQEYDGQFPALSNGAARSRLVRSGKPANPN